MLFFVDSGRNVLITESNLPVTKSAFKLTEFDLYLQAIVTSTKLRPAPAVQIHSSIGGLNYLNVFGEEPVQISISGLVAGSDCETFDRARSALGISMDMFVDLGVVQRATPLQYRIGTSRTRAAYLIGMEVSQDENFSDVVFFQMNLIAEPMTEIEEPRPIVFPNNQVVRQVFQEQLVARPTLIPILVPVEATAEEPILQIRVITGAEQEAILNSRLSVASRAPVVLAVRGSNIPYTSAAVATGSLQSNGETFAPTLVPLTADGFDAVNAGSPE